MPPRLLWNEWLAGGGGQETELRDPVMTQERGGVFWMREVIDGRVWLTFGVYFGSESNGSCDDYCRTMKME